MRNSVAACPPQDQADGSSGTRLQGIPFRVGAAKFTAGKRFTAEASHMYICHYPSTWPDKPPLKVNIATSYEVTFKPRRR